ncbi:cytochrome P450 [Leptodontidium sp. 2 PMI_412]|nr:cytochrome P450 [Leptodontidium sp. 2 PMI_412]
MAALKPTPIPGPSSLPILGNSLDIDPDAALQSLTKLGEKYGPIFQLTFAGETQFIITSQELMDELCDGSRFVKVVTGSLERLRDGVGDALFTAHEGEANWGIAHRILMPIFGTVKIRDMFPLMEDIADQLCLKWARYGSEHALEATDDFTRLTLDTIALCAMDFRFNSFYRDGTLHPFVVSMGGFLKEADKRSVCPDFVNDLRIKSTKNYKHDIATLKKTSQGILDHRRAHPVETDDLLNALLLGKDPQTGQGLDDEAIINNLITFLVAGHETTSGLLSFALYYLLKNPEAYERAQSEVDSTIGTDSIAIEHLSKLPFITAVMRETLRLMPTAPGFTVAAREDTTIGGKFHVKKGQPMTLMLGQIHCDEKCWGPDAKEWKPERMLGENFDNIKPNSWKPFGNGPRGCIGRAFAWQETQLVLAMLLKTFDIKLDDPKYEIRIKESLTIKPDGFRIRATLRHHINPASLAQTLHSSSNSVEAKSLTSKPSSDGARSRYTQDASATRSLNIVFGSNGGTCEALAHRLASNASKHGFKVKSVGTMDAAVGSLSSDQLLIVVTASYDGEPADNARKFLQMLQKLKGDVAGVSYAVFGCGNRDWHQSFHHIPILVDDLLQKNGGTRLVPLGKSDVSTSDAFSDFETWEETQLWPTLGSSFKPGASTNFAISEVSGVQVNITHPRQVTLHQNVAEGVVTRSETLTRSGPVKKHVEIKLPPGMTYQTGDYISVLPLNPSKTVQRALAYFRLPKDSVVEIESATSTSLPLTAPMSASDLLGSYVELTQPATPGDVKKLAALASSESTQRDLSDLAISLMTPEGRYKRASILDLLEKFKDINLSLGSFLEMLPPLRARTYSISSAPLWNPSHATLTISVLSEPSRFDQRQFLGVASNYLSELQEGDVIRVMTRASNAAFHPPEDPDSIPIIMVASGSGLAPFRGFLQERMLQLRGGLKLKPAFLFFGCRSPVQDDLYQTELDEFEQAGIVKVYRAYSGGSEPMYVQEKLWRCNELVKELWDDGAKMFVCGRVDMVDGIKGVLGKILSDGREGQEAKDVVIKLKPSRFVVEVFS